MLSIFVKNIFKFLVISILSAIVYITLFSNQKISLIPGSLFKINSLREAGNSGVILKKLAAVHNSFNLHSGVTFPSAQASSTYENANAFIAVDENTGQILAEKNPNMSLAIASLTKIMSSVVALDLASPGDNITISQSAASVSPTTIGVVPGQQMTVEELLHGMLMTSANDAAQALADGINIKYGQNVFVEAMNEKANLLGLKETSFSNPQGFDSLSNKSSAHDLAILATYALNNYPLIQQIVSKDFVHIPANSYHKQFDLNNWNGLLGVYPGVSGVKIGNTQDAGYTNIVISTREGHKILVVLLGAPGILQRDLWASQLLDDVFAHNFGLYSAHITQDELQQKYSKWQYWN